MSVVLYHYTSYMWFVNKNWFSGHQHQLKSFKKSNTIVNVYSTDKHPSWKFGLRNVYLLQNVRRKYHQYQCVRRNACFKLMSASQCWNQYVMFIYQCIRNNINMSQHNISMSRIISTQQFFFLTWETFELLFYPHQRSYAV